MPTLGAPLDFAKLEARNLRAHQLSAAPSSPVTGQLYYDTVGNVLYWWNGSAWISASGATPPDATASVKGVVQLAGDLAGTAASPQIAAGVITDVDVNPANKDGAVGTASMRTLGLGAQQALPGNARLDQLAIPTTNVSMNSFRLTSVFDPIAAQDAATKNYVDNLIQGLDAKASVKAATTSNIAGLGAGAPNTLDGVTLAQGDRVLVKDQTIATQNGIYVVTTLGTGANGTWTRATDADAWTELPGAYVWVEQGTAGGDTGWLCTVDQGGTLGGTNITWVLFASAGALIAGAGLFKSGNTIDVVAGSGISVGVDTVAVDTTVARYYSSSTHGAGTSWTITQATHGCHATRGLIVQVHDTTTGAWELPDVTIAANGDVTITYAVAVSANSKMVTIIG